MRCDLEGCEFGGCDIIIDSDILGLEVYRCQNWTLGASHGGAISATRIYDGKDVIFQRESRENNQNGVVNYYKTFWKNNSGIDWPSVKVEVTINSSLVFSRESVSVCVGTSTDDMTNKPNDANFSNVTDTILPIFTGGNIPVWIRKNLLAGGVSAARGQDIPIQILLVSAE